MDANEVASNSKTVHIFYLVSFAIIMCLQNVVFLCFVTCGTSILWCVSAFAGIGRNKKTHEKMHFSTTMNVFIVHELVYLHCLVSVCFSYSSLCVQDYCLNTNNTVCLVESAQSITPLYKPVITSNVTEYYYQSEGNVALGVIGGMVGVGTSHFVAMYAFQDTIQHVPSTVILYIFVPLTGLYLYLGCLAGAVGMFTLLIAYMRQQRSRHSINGKKSIWVGFALVAFIAQFALIRGEKNSSSLLFAEVWWAWMHPTWDRIPFQFLAIASNASGLICAICFGFFQ